MVNGKEELIIWWSSYCLGETNSAPIPVAAQMAKIYVLEENYITVEKLMHIMVHGRFTTLSSRVFLDFES